MQDEEEQYQRQQQQQQGLQHVQDLQNGLNWFPSSMYEDRDLEESWVHEEDSFHATGQYLSHPMYHPTTTLHRVTAASTTVPSKGYQYNTTPPHILRTPRPGANANLWVRGAVLRDGARMGIDSRCAQSTTTGVADGFGGDLPAYISTQSRYRPSFLPYNPRQTRLAGYNTLCDVTRPSFSAQPCGGDTFVTNTAGAHQNVAHDARVITTTVSTGISNSNGLSNRDNATSYIVPASISGAMLNAAIKTSGTPAKPDVTDTSSGKTVAQREGRKTTRQRVIFDDVTSTKVPDSRGSSGQDSSRLQGRKDNDDTPIRDDTRPKKTRKHMCLL